MRKHFWFGEFISDAQLDEALKDPSQWALKNDPFLDSMELVDILSKWSLNLDLDINQGFKKDLIEFCSSESLKKKFSKELGGLDKLSFRRVGFSGNYFEKRAPLGILAHILPGNSEGLSFLAAIEGLLVGNTNIVKLSSGETELSLDLAKSLCEFDTSGYISSRLALVRLNSSSILLDGILKVADGVSAWGGDSALSSIRSRLSPQTAFIPWGHKISFSLVSSDKANKADLKLLAHDIISLDQQACSSPQVVFYECNSLEELKKFASILMPHLVEAAEIKGAMSLNISERAELQNQSLIFSFMESQGEGFILEEEDIRILARMESELCPSPLNRTIHLRPIKKDLLFKTLLPWREYLQSCGLICSSREEFLTWSELLVESGVLRVCLPGKMVDSYAGEPHDGHFALARFSKVVRVEVPKSEELASLFTGKSQLVPSHSELMDKEAFQNQRDNGLAKYYFKSGGSSGAPKISRFSYNDYNCQMQAAADGLLAGGLKPNEDRVINLFFGGGLYGGFLSFTTILEKLDCVQLPMGAVEDFDFITSQIIALKVNTLMGMPSFLFQYLQDQKEELLHYGGISKIFYGGEHFSSGQRSWIETTFSIEFIKSASYGSVDAGPIGYQCSHSFGGVHHLNSGLQQLEILKLDSNESVEEIGEIGRLIVTTPAREAMKVERYEIGDLGRWIEERCLCGSDNPRFELLGRMGDIFRAAGNFLNYKKFEKILCEEGYSGEFQLVVENIENKDHLSLNIGLGPDQSFLIDKMTIVAQIKELREAVIDEGTLSFEILTMTDTDLVRTAGSGKLKHVIDKRNY